MAKALLASLAGLTLTVSCGAADRQSTAPLSADAGSPPSPKDALQLLIRNHDVPLSVHPSCEGVGTEFGDTTIGDYVSGFLAELTGPRSSVRASCEPPPNAGENGAAWRCDVWLAHASGSEEWRWGVQFDVDRRSGTMIRESVRCIGMG